MSVVGKVDSLWRYPVKSMRGEELEESFIGFAGVYGDRLFAFRSSGSPEGIPYLTGREQQRMLLCRPRFRHPEKAAKPPNLSEAERMEPGITPIFGDAADLAVDVETPTGEVLSIDDPDLIRLLGEGIDSKHVLTLSRSDRSMTDCRPVSLFSIQTCRQLSDEVDIELDKRRFRANIYIDLGSAGGFEENSFVGKTLQIGPKAVVSILERDPRCKMITLDPDTGESKPEVLRKVVQAHESMAGLYSAVLVEGMVRQGDDIELLN